MPPPQHHTGAPTFPMYGFPHVSLEEALHSLCTIKLRGPQWNPRERHRRNSPTNPDTNPMAKPMRFSQRTNWNTAESELAHAHRKHVAAGLPIADLTASNPTKSGFAHPASLLDALTDRRALEYDPQPKGLLSARKAVCDYYAAHG